MVKDGQLFVIDPAFAQVRPSAWREAVDLANMMLVLGVRTDAERVYNRALLYFTPDEIAEAFAAARGIASPSQLRTMMKSDGRDLVAQFRALAPRARPISLQTWGPRPRAPGRWSRRRHGGRPHQHVLDLHPGRPADRRRAVVRNRQV